MLLRVSAKGKEGYQPKELKTKELKSEQFVNRFS